MIIPTPEFDPLFAEDGVPFQIKMTEYIQREFADVLGPRIGLFRVDNALDILSQMPIRTPRASSDRKAA